MKNIVLIFAILFLFSCTDKKIKNDLIKGHIKGRVKTINETAYYAVDKFGEAQRGQFFYRTLTKYDEKGNIFEMDVFNSDGTVKFKTISKHDEKGNKLERKNYNSDNYLKNKGDTTISKYDSMGNAIEENTYSPDGRLVMKSTYLNDDNGNIIEENSYDSDSHLVYKSINKYEFDKTGNWINQITLENKIPKYIVERGIEYY